MQPLHVSRVDLGSMKNVETNDCFGILASKHLFFSLLPVDGSLLSLHIYLG